MPKIGQTRVNQLKPFWATVESREWLYQKCMVENLSVPAVARMAGCGYWKVWNRMQKFGIPRHSRGFCLSVDGNDNYMRQPGAVNPFLGKTHSEETKRILSKKASVPKPHLRGTGNGMSGRTGSTNPNWKGGASPDRQLFYESQEWKLVSCAVRRRDRYVCQRCNKCKRGRKSMHLHHILGWTRYPSLRCEARNIVVLCRKCHVWVHSNDNVNNEWRGIRAFNRTQAILANIR